jgi:DNA-binding transcriptional MerR regulator/methylmalonyl-CoA mutase cobalamin-binding subunit
VSEPRYRIGTLAKLTGVTTHALRIWERRYQALSPKRTPGGARLYDDDDVQRLRAIKQLLDRGYTISAIATLGIEELARLTPQGATATESLTAPDQGSRAAQLIEDLLQAVAELDLERAGRILVQATNSFSPHDLVTTVLAPTLDELGRRWESGDICIASEHAASAMLRTQLGMLLAAQPVNGMPSVVCTTPAGEQHELGALLAAVLIAMHGRRAIYLGASLPVDQIVQAARLAKAGSVALSLVGLTPEAALAQVEELCQLLPAEVTLLVGGRRAQEVREFPARVRVLSSLPELESWLRTAPH